MRDAGMMRGVERIEDLDADPSAESSGSAPRCRRAASVSPSRYGITRYVVPSCVPMSYNGTDVRMVDLRDDARFAVEPLAHAADRRPASAVRILIATVRCEAGVRGLVDLPHPAGANQRHDLVRAEPRTGIKGHGAASRIIAARSLVRAPFVRRRAAAFVPQFRAATKRCAGYAFATARAEPTSAPSRRPTPARTRSKIRASPSDMLVPAVRSRPTDSRPPDVRDFRHRRRRFRHLDCHG